MNTGIYRIINKRNNKFYIGSASNLKLRKAVHFSLLKNNKHPNKHLQSAYNIEPEMFEFEVLCICDKDMLLYYEQRFIDFYSNTYNIRKIAESNLGIKRSNETKLKMRDAHKKPVNQYTKDGIYINTFLSIDEAAKSLGVKRNNIGNCLTNIRNKTAYGFKWSYAE